jgi:hypothetical protein
MTHRPNFFIVGAPKCGTTAMNEYLSHHPAVFMSPKKEPYYFGHDLSYRMKRLSSEEYLALFDGVSGETIVGEASTTYLFSSTAAREIHRFNPGSRILIMLRDPVEMMYSLHSQLLYSGMEDINDFGAALKAEPDRRSGRRIPLEPQIIEFLFYRGFADYAPQVRRYFEVFGQDAVHVVLFDDFRLDPATAYRRTLQFLGVDAAVRPLSFEIINANKFARNNWLRTVLGQSAVVSAVRAAIPNRRLRQGLAGWVGRSLMTRKRQRPPMDEQIEDALRREFAPRIDELSQLLGIALSEFWTR